MTGSSAEYPEATVKELLNELERRNTMMWAHPNHQAQTAEHLRKVRLSFSLRPGGLEATRMDA